MPGSAEKVGAHAPLFHPTVLDQRQRGDDHRPAGPPDRPRAANAPRRHGDRARQLGLGDRRATDVGGSERRQGRSAAPATGRLPSPGPRSASTRECSRATASSSSCKRAPSWGWWSSCRSSPSDASCRDLDAVEKKRRRWEWIIQEAAEQCRRGRKPALRPATFFPQACEQARQSGGLSLIPWEEESLAELASTCSAMPLPDRSEAGHP